MSLVKFEIFHTIVELGSLSKAAEALGLTQSAVSHAIASLEAEWGFLLLQRDRSGVRLTSNGERMLKLVRDILQRNEQLKQEVAAINGLEVGIVRIGTFTSVSTHWLPGVIRMFHMQHPSINIKLLEGDYDEIHRWITDGTVDFGFLSLSASKSLQVVPLKKDRLVCIIPEEHSLASQTTIAFRQLENEDFIMPKWGSDHDVRRVLKENRVSPKIKYEAVEEQAIMAMVQHGLGISILPEMVLFHMPRRVRAINFEGNHYRTIGIAATSFNHLSPAAKKFIDCLKMWLDDQGLLDF
ncbi:LysR family transcriptional regulator [Anoxybacteroides tepidamans]|uniref:LysR family transcriptional regulator n=1 Tax=Anoxybacteroides tepidamans TaxID=265948 RepID=UPI000484357C|nr:LysR family transcriptional regulator [Anoxybacillus tepidamans]